MKIMIPIVMAAALLACGGKNKKTSATPENKTGTTETKPEGAGGTTYGGAPAPAQPAAGQDPCAGM